jgi:FkbM family methyltransferase
MVVHWSSFIKAAIRRTVGLLIEGLSAIRIGRRLQDEFLRQTMARSVTVRHRDVAMEFVVPNQLNLFRAQSFSDKEPETLEWIDSMEQGAVLWDIGANIGLYSIYAAKSRKCSVYAFEPSVFNLEILARNVNLNGLAASICIVPIALSDSIGPSSLNMSSTDWGGSLSTFDRTFGHDGAPLNATFDYQTIGLTIDSAADVLGIARPDYLKLDVDGIEHLILQGGGDVLCGVRGVLVEINDNFKEQSVRSRVLLEAAGLVLRDKCHQSYLKGSNFENTANQIWFRNS